MHMEMEERIGDIIDQLKKHRSGYESILETRPETTLNGYIGEQYRMTIDLLSGYDLLLRASGNNGHEKREYLEENAPWIMGEMTKSLFVNTLSHLEWDFRTKHSLRLGSQSGSFTDIVDHLFYNKLITDKTRRSLGLLLEIRNMIVYNNSSGINERKVLLFGEKIHIRPNEPFVVDPSFYIKATRVMIQHYLMVLET